MARVLLLLLALGGLAGCAAPATASLGALAAANVASIPVFGRTLPDLAVSGVTGRNCSVVHFEQGKPYCALPEKAPPAPPYCTPSLGYADCWSSPGVLPDPPQGVADGPFALTPAQERNRTKPWLDLGF